MPLFRFINHEKSKKHKENVAYLRSVLEAEDAEVLGILDDDDQEDLKMENQADQKKNK